MIRCLLVFLLVVQCAPAPVWADVFSEDEDPSPTGPVPRYEPDREALRSLVFPGWSQHRQGAPNAGWAYTTIAALTFVFMIGVADVPVLGSEDDNFGQVFAGVLYAMNAVVSGFDAYNRAVESNRENGWDLGEQAAARPSGLRIPLVRLSF